eukprot:SAG31_NODE_11_length_38734_cov_21.263854_6_plen_119_part_00
MPVDELKIVSCWDPKLLSDAKLAITVRGLLLQGCNFDGEKLTEALLNSASHSVLGDCTFAWVPQLAASPYPKDASVLAPLYTTTDRDAAVTEVMLPSARHDTTRWTLAGCALFISDES